MQFCWGTLFTTPLNHQRFDDYHWLFAADFAGELYLLPSWIAKDLMIFIDFLLLICMKTFENLMVFMQISWWTLFTTPLNHQRFDDYHWFFAADLHENLWKLDGFHAILLGNFIYYPPGSPKIWWFSLIFCCWFAWKPLKTWWFSCNFAVELYLLPSWITKDLMIFIDFLLLICMKTFENLMVFMQISWGTLFTTLLDHQRFDDFHWFFAADLHENLWKLDGFHANQLGNFIYYPPESPKIWWFSLIFCCWFAWKPMKTWWLSCKSAEELYLPPSWITKDLMIFIDFCCWFACFQQF